MTSGGILFQKRLPASGNARSPAVLVLRWITLCRWLNHLGVYNQCSQSPLGRHSEFQQKLEHKHAHCWLGHLTHENPSPIWPIMCLLGHLILLSFSCVIHRPKCCRSLEYWLGVSIFYIGHNVSDSYHWKCVVLQCKLVSGLGLQNQRSLLPYGQSPSLI